MYALAIIRQKKCKHLQRKINYNFTNNYIRFLLAKYFNQHFVKNKCLINNKINYSNCILIPRPFPRPIPRPPFSKKLSFKQQ